MPAPHSLTPTATGDDFCHRLTFQEVIPVTVQDSQWERYIGTRVINLWTRRQDAQRQPASTERQVQNSSRAGGTGTGAPSRGGSRRIERGSRLTCPRQFEKR